MCSASLVKELGRYKSLPEKLKFLGQHLQTRHGRIERFSVALYQETTDRVRTFYTTSPLEDALVHYDFPLTQARWLSQLALAGQPRIIDDLTELVAPKNSGKVNPHTQKLFDQGWRSSYTAPLVSYGDLQGFVFFNSRSPGAFTDDLHYELALLSQLIAQLIYQEQAAVRTLIAAVRSTMSLCAGRDPETGGHLERMAQYAQLIAAHLAPKWTLSDRQIQHLLLFAPLHDLGKLAIPDRILLKPGKLTEQEFLKMQEHTTLGVELLERVISHHGLESLPDVQMLKNLVLYHHEHLDGSGYPFGLSGEAIPIEARIIAVADVFDALTSDRPYKKAWTLDAAFKELERLAGSHLDEDCIEAFIEQREQVEYIFQQLQSDVTPVYSK